MTLPSVDFSSLRNCSNFNAIRQEADEGSWTSQTCVFTSCFFCLFSLCLGLFMCLIMQEHDVTAELRHGDGESSTGLAERDDSK